jgi:hypothetical protein
MNSFAFFGSQFHHPEPVSARARARVLCEEAP